MPDQPRATTVEPAAQLRAAGLRVTAPRAAVLRVVSERPHSDADTIARHVRAALGAVSTQAVYDVLRALVAGDLLRRIEPAGSAARYESRVADNHHHLVCRTCGTVVDVDCVVGAAPCLTPDDPHGFAVDEAEVTFWGTCPDCLAADRAARTDQTTRRTDEKHDAEEAR